MKYPFLLFLFSLLAFQSYSQTEKYFDYRWQPCNPEEARFYAIINKTDSGYVRKDYFIHERSLQMSGKYKDADCTIQDGSFFYFHPNGNLSSLGQYVNGKRDGVWQSFHSNGAARDSVTFNMGGIVGIRMSWHANGYIADSLYVKEDGTAVNISWFDNGVPSSAGRLSASGKQQGKWIYYHNNGKCSAIETYDEGILLNKLYFDEEEKPEADTTSKDRDAVYGNGANAWQNYMARNCYFPNQYKLTNADKAVVEVSFEVNEAGQVENAFVSTPFHPEFDRIALKAVQQSNKWKPAISHNRKIKTRLIQSLTFAQQD